MENKKVTLNKNLINTVIKQIISSLVILFLFMSFIFTLIRISPGSPVQRYISSEFSPLLVQKVNESFRLNEPLHEQYFNFLISLTSGNLGISYEYRLPVIRVISEYLPFTIYFAFTCFLVQIVVSVILAFLSARKFNGLFDKAVSNISLGLYASPVFVIGLFLIYLFSVKLHFFPTSGLSSFGTDDLSFVEILWDRIIHLILPVITLSLGGIAIFYKYLRDSLEEIYNKPFVLYLRSSGYSERAILFKNVIPNAINPFISVAGIELGLLMSGALITEVVFGLPGMGRLTINAIFTRDYPLIVGCSFIAGILMILCNLFADIIKIFIDKRLVKGILN